MRNRVRRAWITIPWMAVSKLALGQIFGQIGAFNYYETSAVPVDGVIIGSPGTQINGVGLLVDGANLNTATGEVFRTYSPANMATNWRLFRGTLEIGRIFANANSTNLGYNIMQMQPGGRLWLRNYGTGTAAPGDVNTNGLSLPDDWNPAATPPTVASWPLRRLGFFALGDALTMQSSSNYTGMPWSRLHLVHTQDVSSVQDSEFGWRWWMRNGLLITGNDDQMYVGHKYVGSYDDGTEVQDESDAVIQWSENNLQEGRTLYDNCRFLFTTKDGDGGNAGTVEGLELMRLRPYRADAQGDIEGFVGVGDWFGQGAEPEERLDVLDRTILIRRLVPDYEEQTLRKFVVTDDDGRLHWRDINNLPDNCEWTMGGGPNSANLFTAVGSASGCPGDDNFVGIGTTTPVAKLHVKNTHAFGTFNYAGLFTVNTSQPTNVGVKTEATGSGAYHYGAQNWAANASTENVGTYSRGYANNGSTVGLNAGSVSHCWVASSSTVSTNVAVDASTTIQSSSVATNNFGVRANATNHSSSNSTNYGGWFKAASPNSTTSTNWGIWVEGDPITTASLWQTSDASFKQNVQSITNGLAKILQLYPRSFEFDLANYGWLGLPGGAQLGFIAQELESVVPELVRDVTRGADLDSTGSVVQAELNFKAIQPDGLIPLLVAAVQEQNAMLVDLQSQLADLQSQVVSCCDQANDGRTGQQHSATMGAEAKHPSTIMTIQPNPFETRTNVGYTVAHAGYLLLVVTAPSGKQIQVLREGLAEPGNYSYEWETSSLSSGMYYVTLLLDGEVVTKKAVKL